MQNLIFLGSARVPQRRMDQQELSRKILFLGDVGTGKTCIIKRSVYDTFSIRYKTTIACDYALKKFQYRPNIHVRLGLWDISGAERKGPQMHRWCQDAVAAFIVFDGTRPSTLEGARKWKAKLDFIREEKLPVILLMNKSDLWLDPVPTLNDENMAKFCQENGFVACLKTSAKDCTGLEEAFMSIVEEIMSRESC